MRALMLIALCVLAPLLSSCGARRTPNLGRIFADARNGPRAENDALRCAVMNKIGQ